MTVELGRAAELILQVANEEMVDLIVVGSRGLGPIGSVVLGSVSAHLVDHATCPVLVVRSPEATRMLLATDGTPSSREIPHVLAGWGTAFRGLPVEVLSVAHGEGFVTPWAAEEGEHGRTTTSSCTTRSRSASRGAGRARMARRGDRRAGEPSKPDRRREPRMGR